MSDKKLLAEKRELTGRKLKALRASGLLPANVYGKGIDSISLTINLKEFDKVFKEVGETGIVSLEVGKEVKPVMVANVQRNPKTDDLIHVDFRQINLKEKIEASIPVVLAGESPAEKQSLGTVVLQMTEIDVEALPADLPEKFEVSVDGLTEVDQAIYVKDIKVSKDVEVKTDLEAIVVKVEPPQKEEVEEVKPAEGEAPVEGTASTAESTETPANSDQAS